MSHRLFKLLELLLEQKLIDDKTAQHAQQQTSNVHEALDLLIHENHLSANDILLACKQRFNLDVIALETLTPEALLKNLLPQRFMLKHRVLVTQSTPDVLCLITSDPFDREPIELLKFQTQLSVKLCLANHSKIKNILNRHPHERTHAPAESTEPPSDDPIIALINHILSDAHEQKASDIHFEPGEKEYRIRYRQDGLLREAHHPPLNMAHRMSSCLKIMAHCDISEKRLPQDGRFTFTLKSGQEIDCRLNTCPTVHGEKIVTRLLTHSKKQLDIDELGLLEAQKECLLKIIQKPQGMILVTGPTGSGKTITLYTLLSLLNTKERNISSVENPVEIRLEGINQVNINPKTNLCFATVLRTLLRQDPDVMMIGEIRDTETAEMAIRSAQTGHLILSTLHTNNAIESLARLHNMGIEKFNIVHSVSLIVAQRLLRKLCSYCKIKKIIDEPYCALYSLKKNWLGLTHYTAGTCERCIDGYRGRVGIYEILVLDKTIHDLFLKGSSLDAYSHHLNSIGFMPLFAAALEKVKDGTTSFLEMMRVIQ